jgi:hypothetical protein
MAGSSYERADLAECGTRPCFTSRPPVFTNLCCKLADDHWPVLFRRTIRRHRFPTQTHTFARVGAVLKMRVEDAEFDGAPILACAKVKLCISKKSSAHREGAEPIPG